MNKCTLQSILDAFEIVVKPGIEDGCGPSRVEEAYKALEAAFVRQLHKPFAELVGDDLRKEVAVRELRKAHERFFDSLPEMIKPPSNAENIAVIFKVMTDPWLDFFES